MGNLLEPGGGAPVGALTQMWRGVYRKAAEAAEARLQQLLADHVYQQHGRRAVSVVLDGAGQVLTPGAKCDLEAPWGYVVEGWALYADAVGSLVLDLRTAADYAAYPTVASICGATKPALASARKAQALTLTDWDAALPRGAVLRVVVESATTITLATLTLYLRAV